MGQPSERVQRLRRRLSGTTAINAVEAFRVDLEQSAYQDEPDEETSSFNLENHSFTTTISFQDLQRLRAIVKKVHLRHYPAHMISDFEADRVIDAMGPITQERLIRKAVEHGLV